MLALQWNTLKNSAFAAFFFLNDAVFTKKKRFFGNFRYFMHSSPWKPRSCIKVHKLYLCCNNIPYVKGYKARERRGCCDISSENSVEIDPIDFLTAKLS
jgi:hypothetical protein